MFRTRHAVRIVPAAPSCEATLTAAVRSEQSAVEGVASLVEVLASVVVAAVFPPVDDAPEAGAVGTGPASCAPFPSQAAARRTRAKAMARVLVMGRV